MNTKGDGELARYDVSLISSRCFIRQERNSLRKGTKSRDKRLSRDLRLPHSSPPREAGRRERGLKLFQNGAYYWRDVSSPSSLSLSLSLLNFHAALAGRR